MTEPVVTCDSCCDNPFPAYPMCKDCGFCVRCAAGTICEGEALCSTCIYYVADWAIRRLLELGALEQD